MEGPMTFLGQIVYKELTHRIKEVSGNLPLVNNPISLSPYPSGGVLSSFPHPHTPFYIPYLHTSPYILIGRVILSNHSYIQ